MANSEKRIELILAENLKKLMQATPQYNSNPKLANATHTGTGTISRIRNAETSATIDTVSSIAERFGLEPADLLRSDLFDENGKISRSPRPTSEDDEWNAKESTATHNAGEARAFPKALWPLFDTIAAAWKTSSLPEPLLQSFEQLFRSLPAGAAQEPITTGSKEDDELTQRAVKNLSKRIKNQTGMPYPDKNGQDEKN